MRNLTLLSEKHLTGVEILENGTINATFTKSPTDNRTYFLTSTGEIIENGEVLSIILY